jgi:uncharacterized membrane protein YfcA
MPGGSGMLAFGLLALLAEILGTLGGFGSSMFFVPVAQLFFEFNLVLGITSVFHVFSNLSKIWLFRKTINYRLVVLIGLPGTVAVLAGAWLQGVAGFSYTRLVLGLFLFLFALLMLLFPNWKMPENRKLASVAGAVAGFLAGFTGTGGAVRGLALSAFGLPGAVFLGTSASIDLFVDSGRALIYWYNGYFGSKEAALIPLLLAVSVLGSWAGKKILEHLPETVFRKTVLLLIMATGLMMLVQTYFDKFFIY